MKVDLCWKYLVLSFSLLHLHYAYLRLKECMHSSIYIVFLHNKTFSKNPYYPVRGHQNFQWQNCKKIAPSNPNWLEFRHCKVFGVHRPEKDPRLLFWHGKWEDPENGRNWKWTARDTRENCPNDENDDKLNKRERDYWWSRSTKKAVSTYLSGSGQYSRWMESPPIMLWRCDWTPEI